MASIITGGKMVSVEAKRDKNDVPQGMNMNVEIKDVAANKEELTIEFVFIAKYLDEVGYIKFNGLVTLKEDDAKTAKEIAKGWKENKKVSDEMAELIMNYAAYSGGIAGTYVSQILGLNPPIILPPIRVQKQAGGTLQPTPGSKPEQAA